MDSARRSILVMKSIDRGGMEILTAGRSPNEKEILNRVEMCNEFPLPLVSLFDLDRHSRILQVFFFFFFFFFKKKKT
jgi:hypothetical protein